MLILCRLGWRLNNTKLGRGLKVELRVAHAGERTLHPADVFQRSNRIGGMRPPVYCNAGLCVHQCLAQRIGHQDRPLDRYGQAPEDMQYCAVSLILAVSRRAVEEQTTNLVQDTSSS